MKSSQKKLQQRGYVTKEEIKQLEAVPINQLITLLHSEKATQRSAAAYNLSPHQELNVKELLNQLSIEKSLYTKIAIAETLQQGNHNTAKQMMQYLGNIGNNQYRKLPEKPSKKMSYPLPRDIIARTLGKMNADIFTTLIDFSLSITTAQLSELIDAIGFMVFYNKNIANEENAKPIYEIIKSYSQDELILWKSIVCLSSFPTPHKHSHTSKLFFP